MTLRLDWFRQPDYESKSHRDELRRKSCTTRWKQLVCVTGTQQPSSRGYTIPLTATKAKCGEKWREFASVRGAASVEAILHERRCVDSRIKSMDSADEVSHRPFLQLILTPADERARIKGEALSHNQNSIAKNQGATRVLHRLVQIN